jgi:hypothetical protein
MSINMSPMPLVPDDLSEEQLKWGYWFVTHKLMLRRILVVVLSVFCAASLIFSGYRLTLDILDAENRAKQLAELYGSQVNHRVTLAQAPKPLSRSDAQVLATQGKYDLIGTLSNPNQYFAADFKYRFTSGNFATSPENGFILPGEQKFITKLGVASETRPSGATLEIIETTWKRIDRHKYPDWKGFVAGHLDLFVSDINYTPDIELVKDKPPIGKTSFALANRTGYGYYGVKATVIIYRGPVIVAVNSTAFAAMPPGAQQKGEVTWYEDYGAVTQIKVFPEVDILNDASYMRSI